MFGWCNNGFFAIAMLNIKYSLKILIFSWLFWKQFNNIFHFVRTSVSFSVSRASAYGNNIPFCIQYLPWSFFKKYCPTDFQRRVRISGIAIILRDKFQLVSVSSWTILFFLDFCSNFRNLDLKAQKTPFLDIHPNNFSRLFQILFNFQ